MRLLTARWVFPVTAPPIADGAVAIRAGEIAGVGPRAKLVADHPGADRLHLEEAALLPGLVNCHTHLELPAGPPTDADGTFAEWLVGVIEGRRQRSPEDQAACADAGARALLESGTTCVGDVSTSGQSLGSLLRAGLRGVVYREILGLSPAEAAGRCETARGDLERMGQTAQGSLLTVGLSPHSPYSLSEALFEACGALLSASRVPCCIHAAESREEGEFLATGGGAIPRRLYPAVGCTSAPRRRPARSPIEYLEALGALGWRPLLIHAVHVDEADCRRMADRDLSVAHCPRSNARLSGGTAPVADFLRHGIVVGLGTDSLASVPTLDLWDEMRACLAVHRGRVTPADILAMATLGGARALGLADRVGSIEVGKRADLTAVSVREITATDPVGSLVAGTRGEDVMVSLVEGEIRHRRLEGVVCG
ncbi:MAG: amidohydrolase family protein [Candidatus Methylomirabilota bacterium]